MTFFERIDNVYAHDKPLSLFFQYIWARVPEFAFFILPVTALTTTLLALGILTKFNEVTAMKACGISLYRLIFPVLFMALVGEPVRLLPPGTHPPPRQQQGGGDLEPHQRRPVAELQLPQPALGPGPGQEPHLSL